MQYDITLSGDDVLTIISLLENAGSAQLAVKVRDQMYEQRQRFFATFGQGAKPQQKPMSDKEAVDYLNEIFGGAR